MPGEYELWSIVINRPVRRIAQAAVVTTLVAGAIGLSVVVLAILAILAATVANIGNITLFGTYLLGIINPTGTFDNVVVWVVSAAMMGVVIYIAIRGIRPSIRFQTAIIVFEYAIVIVFVLLALKREFIDAAVGTTAPSASAFTIGPAGFGGLGDVFEAFFGGGGV